MIRRGVTLVELLVTIAIICILAALLMPALGIGFGPQVQDEGTCTKVYTKIGGSRITQFMAVFQCKSGKTLTFSCDEGVWNTINTNESYRIKYVDSFTDHLISADK